MSGETEELVPHLDQRGQEEFGHFQAADSHRAFVIAPGGTWVWNADMPLQELALQAALRDLVAAA